jgi:hypothetical protein
MLPDPLHLPGDPRGGVRLIEKIPNLLTELLDRIGLFEEWRLVQETPTRGNNWL